MLIAWFSGSPMGFDGGAAECEQHESDTADGTEPREWPVSARREAVNVEFLVHGRSVRLVKPTA